MHILVTGAAGMVGRKLIEHLAQVGRIGGREIESALLHDIVEPTGPEFAPFKIETVAERLSNAAELSMMVQRNGANVPVTLRFPEGE